MRSVTSESSAGLPTDSVAETAASVNTLSDTSSLLNSNNNNNNDNESGNYQKLTNMATSTRQQQQQQPQQQSSKKSKKTATNGGASTSNNGNNNNKKSKSSSNKSSKQAANTKHGEDNQAMMHSTENVATLVKGTDDDELIDAASGTMRRSPSASSLLLDLTVTAGAEAEANCAESRLVDVGGEDVEATRPVALPSDVHLRIKDDDKEEDADDDSNGPL